VAGLPKCFTKILKYGIIEPYIIIAQRDNIVIMKLSKDKKGE
jgi:hypothetical protein